TCKPLAEVGHALWRFFKIGRYRVYAFGAFALNCVYRKPETDYTSRGRRRQINFFDFYLPYKITFLRPRQGLDQKIGGL
ncbi:hypothetical protein, partial [Corynebacterium amycolatum]|uniref:hypothetical protein n=1 Tax=Corynebacterium amycolatum TaxID=43765 RepID=UPI00254BBA33